MENLDMKSQIELKECSFKPKINSNSMQFLKNRDTNLSFGEREKLN